MIFDLSNLSSPSDKESSPLDYISASRLKCWQECRLKFFFRYVEKVSQRPAPALFIGQTAHKILEQWNLNRWRNSPVSEEELKAYFEATWEETQPVGINWKDKESSHKEKCWNMLEYYFQHTPIPETEKPEAVEAVVERDLDLYGLPPLRGVIDLVREGGRIVDFKTAARTPDPAMANHVNEAQLGCYALLYRESTGQLESGLELHHLIKTKDPKLVITTMEPVNRVQMQRLVKQMQSYVSGIEARDFVPSPGMHCAWCDFYKQCREFSPA